MFTKSKQQKAVVGLDVEAGSIAATEVQANGHVEVTQHGVLPLNPGIFREGEIADVEALTDAIKELFSKHKLSKQVRLGIANQRVAVRTLHLPPIDNPGELETAIRFQAQDHIPMPLDQAVLDWEVVGHVTSESGEPRIEVVAVAARRDMVASMMDALQSAGLRPVGIDLSAFGMIRALVRDQHASVGASGFVTEPTTAYEERFAPETAGTVPDAGVPDAGVPDAGVANPESAVDAPVPARLYCSLGDVTNLAVAQGSSCLFTRISPFGIEGIAQRLAERRKLTLEHARQWLTHVGLEAPVEQVEGDQETVAAAREVLGEGASKLVDELRLSLEFYGTQEGAVAVEGVVACGPGTTVPGLVEHLQRALGHPFQVGRPKDLEHLDEAAAARLTLSYGLALEE